MNRTMSYSHRFRDDDNRLVLPRLVQAIRRNLRDHGLTGDPWTIVRRKGDLRVERLALDVYLGLPAELRAADRDFAWRLCYAAAATAKPILPKRGDPSASPQPAGVAS